MWEAKGSHERAVVEYKKVLNSRDVEKLEPTSVEFLINQVTECLIKLGDAKGIEEWLEELKEFQEKHSQSPLKNSFVTRQDTNYIAALAKFDQDLFEDASYYMGRTSRIEKVNRSRSHIQLEDCGYEPVVRMHSAERLLLQAMLAEEKKESLRSLGLAKALLEEPLRVASIDSLREAHPSLIQLHCIHILETSQPIEISPLLRRDKALDVTTSDIGLWTKILRVRKHAKELGHADLVKSAEDQRLCFHMVQLARKQKNYQLARRFSFHPSETKITDDLACRLLCRVRRNQIIVCARTEKRSHCEVV